MKTFDRAPSIALYPDQEYGIEFVVRLSDEAVKIAEEKDWAAAFQTTFYGVRINHCTATVVRPSPLVPVGGPEIVFAIAFTVPADDISESPIYFDVASRQFADYAAMILGAGDSNSQDVLWIAARVGEPGELSQYYTGYENLPQRPEPPTTPLGTLFDFLPRMGEALERWAKYALIGIGGIILIKVIDWMRD